MKIEYCLSQLLPRVFVLQMADRYDLAMTFWRAQEFHESPMFRGGVFTLEKYMQWYAKAHGNGSFTYADDWSGFNIPSGALEACYASANESFEYDKFMVRVMAACKLLSGDAPYYLIGVNPSESDVLEHEIAHALYGTNDEYQFDMQCAVYDLPSDTYANLIGVLQKLGYSETVFYDEIQAYLATGLYTGMDFVTIEQRERFIKIYNKYSNNSFVVTVPYMPVITTIGD